jgi:hypothetical protein
MSISAGGRNRLEVVADGQDLLLGQAVRDVAHVARAALGRAVLVLGIRAMPLVEVKLLDGIQDVLGGLARQGRNLVALGYAVLAVSGASLTHQELQLLFRYHLHFVAGQGLFCARRYRCGECQKCAETGALLHGSLLITHFNDT